MNKLVLVIIIAILLVGGAILLFGGRNQTAASPSTNPGIDNPVSGIVIKMTDSGFEPSKVTIKQGKTVTFTNVGQLNHWPASNIHPTHQIYPEFDPKKDVLPGESWSFTFDKIGSWRMHDHEYPNFTGTITVQ